MQIAMTYSRIRTEERMLINAFEKLNVDIDLIDLRKTVFDLNGQSSQSQYDLVIDRSISLTHSTTATQIFESFGVRCMNPLTTLELCSDKLATSLALIQSGIPTPQVRVALSQESGVEAIESLGYPAVVKPTVGSWGRLVARVNDRDAAEAILEHRTTLGSAQQNVLYLQEHIQKPSRDVRVFVVNHQPIAAIARYSSHWVTNTARGATVENIQITDELAELSIQASRAVQADVVAVDFLECPVRGLLVNELNHSMEFRNSSDATGVDIAQCVAQHAIHIAEQQVVSRASNEMRNEVLCHE